MGKEKEINGGQIFDTMFNFARLGTSRGVNNFVLAGPVDVPAVFHTFVGKFPDLNESDSSIAVSGSRGSSSIDVYSQILHLEIPKRVEDLKIVDNDQIRKRFEAASVRGNLPSIVIGIGEAKDTREKVVILFSIMGISPKKGLLEMQDRIKSRMAKFN